jgi:hypothetical protein
MSWSPRRRLRPHEAQEAWTLKRAAELFLIDEWGSDSGFVEKVWRSRSEPEPFFLSVAASRWQIVVTTQRDHSQLTVRGPETRATVTAIPADALAGVHSPLEGDTGQREGVTGTNHRSLSALALAATLAMESAGPTDEVVAATTIDFFDIYLNSDKAALDRLSRHGDVTGIAPRRIRAAHRLEVPSSQVT